MSRTKVKNSNLAKLREYRKGMDVQDYLQTEFRQVLRSLQNLYVDDDTSSDGTSEVEMIGIPCLYAQNKPSFNLGVVSLADNVLKSGTVAGGVYTPKTSGKYWVEFGCEFVAGTSGTVSNNLIAKYASGVSAHTLLTAVDTTIGGPKYPIGACFMDLTPSNGVYFEMTGNANTIGFNFHLKITKVL